MNVFVAATKGKPWIKNFEPITSVMSVQCFGMMIFYLILFAEWLFLKNSSSFGGQLWTNNKFK